MGFILNKKGLFRVEIFCVSVKANDGTLFATDVYAENEQDAIAKAGETKDFQDFVKNGLAYSAKHESEREFAILHDTIKAVHTV